MNKGSRNGSGKIVQDNFNFPNEIPFGTGGDLVGQSSQNANDNQVQGMCQSINQYQSLIQSM